MPRIDPGPGSGAWPRARLRHSFAALAVTLLAATTHADPVLADGASTLETTFGRTRVTVTLETRAHALEALEVRVDGYAIALPAASLTKVPDPREATVTRRDDGQFLLRVEASDTTGRPITVEWRFDRLALRARRTLDAGGAEIQPSFEFEVPPPLD